jgi:hypothetical protein
MGRGMSAAFIASIQEQNLRPAIFFEGQFASGFLRLWSGVGDISWNGQTWSGAGTLLGISSIEESGEVVAQGTSISLSGVPVDLVALCISDAQQGLPGKLWLGLLTTSGGVIADPVQAFVGRLDVPRISHGGESCTITISYESRLIDLNAPREFRYTDESQKQLYPGDRAFEYVTTIQGQDIVWGSSD